ncbi:MAG: sulfurtransferase TusA family protein [Thermoplasmata archaeon]
MTMSEAELKNLKGTKVVDARGTSCPGPLLAAKKTMSEVPVNGIMEVLSSDPGTNKDIPAWCTKVGHEYLGLIAEPSYWRLFVRRKK